jgi:pyrroline-5-carboxylate reductase
MRVAIIGVGNLGGVVAQRLLASGYPRDELTLITRGSERARARCNELEIAPSDLHAVAEADVIVLTVKPQDAPDLAQMLGVFLKPTTLILSLMAGVSCKTLARTTNHELIARAMPNLGASIGESATTYYLTPAARDCRRQQCEQVVSALGNSWEVSSEQFIDLATAIAGSGPAYLCWLGEQIEQFAQDHGFSKSDAHAIILQTFKGAVAFLEASSIDFSEMRAKVTSPQGTTAAAISVLEASRAGEIIRHAVLAALTRAQELDSVN